MQVSVESIGKLERRMQVQVPAERVSKEIATRLKHLSRTARLNGFRPGKAPLTVIRQQFGQQVHREVIGELLQSSFTEAVTQKQLAPAGSPRIEPKSIGEGQDLTYVATFEVFPEVALQPIDSLEVERVTRRCGRERHRCDDRAAAQTADEIHARDPRRGERRQGDRRFRRLDRRRAVCRRQGRQRRDHARRRPHARRSSSKASSAPRRAR